MPNMDFNFDGFTSATERSMFDSFMGVGVGGSSSFRSTSSNSSSFKNGSSLFFGYAIISFIIGLIFMCIVLFTDNNYGSISESILSIWLGCHIFSIFTLVFAIIALHYEKIENKEYEIKKLLEDQIKLDEKISKTNEKIRKISKKIRVYTICCFVALLIALFGSDLYNVLFYFYLYEPAVLYVFRYLGGVAFVVGLFGHAILEMKLRSNKKYLELIPKVKIEVEKKKEEEKKKAQEKRKNKKR